MTLSDVSLVFDAALAGLLAVMIFYSVRLNKRILLLRDREGELQQMISQFNDSSVIAQESAQKLRSAGTEAEFGVKAAIAKGMALRNDLELMLDQADYLVDRLESSRADVPPAPQMAKADDRPARQMPIGDDRPAPSRPATPPPTEPSNIKAFSPPVRSAEEVIRAETPTETDDAALIQPRSEAERDLLNAIRAAKEGTA
jgi:hypothetical protein